MPESPIPPVVTFSKVADVAFADPGDVITYTLSYANTGTGTATGVVASTTLDTNLSPRV